MSDLEIGMVCLGFVLILVADIIGARQVSKLLHRLDSLERRLRQRGLINREERP